MTVALQASVSFLPGMALAVGIGLLIGFERGWRLREQRDGGRVAGVRTFVLLALLGAVAGLAASTPFAGLALVCATGATAAILVGYAIDMRREDNVSATGAVAAMLTLLLGGLAATGHSEVAAVGAGVTVAVLASRDPLHKLVRATSEDDVEAFLRLALLIFLILPLLPDAGLGPFGSLNPRRLWFVVVIVGSIAFGGYVLTRWLGTRVGGVVTGLLGAIVSSTAVTVASAQAIRSGGGFINQASIALASTIMLVRTLLLVALLAPAVLGFAAALIVPALLFSVAASAITVWAGRSSAPAGADLPVKPPGLRLAFLFGLLVAVISFAAAMVEHLLGDIASASVVAFGGMVDVDSAIAAIGALPPGALSPRLAAIAIATPIAFNSLLKLGLALGIAGWRGTRWATVNLAITATILLGGVAATVF